MRSPIKELEEDLLKIPIDDVSPIDLHDLGTKDDFPIESPVKLVNILTDDELDPLRKIQYSTEEINAGKTDALVYQRRAENLIKFGQYDLAIKDADQLIGLRSK